MSRALFDNDLIASRLTLVVCGLEFRALVHIGHTDEDATVLKPYVITPTNPIRVWW